MAWVFCKRTSRVHEVPAVDAKEWLASGAGIVSENKDEAFLRACSDHSAKAKPEAVKPTKAKPVADFIETISEKEI